MRKSDTIYGSEERRGDSMEFWTYLVETAKGWSREANVIRFVFALLAGTLIGIDREYKNRGAGIKTHVLVCLGSAMVMMTSHYIAVTYPDIKSDVTRIPAQVISGIGFLGVGTIIVTGKNQVRGLTTAAGLWASACLGLAAGIGYIEGATLGTVLVLFTLKVLNLLDVRIHKNAKYFDLYVEFETNQNVSLFIEEMRRHDIKFSNFNITKAIIKGDGPSATLSVEIPNPKVRETFLNEVHENGIVKYIEEL